MKLFELMPEKITDFLPPLLNKDVPPPIDQIALQVTEMSKLAGYAGIGLAVKTRNYALTTFNDLVAAGEQALGKETATPEATAPETIETPVEEAKPVGPTQKELFEQASVDIKSLSKKPDNSTLGELYALYKQATEGDASGKRPGITKVAERFKFDAWSRKKGLSESDAERAYIDKVQSLLAAH
ncbi:acyl-CoA-binding protein [Litoribacillus peritrichatus]|uniref:ACB domain-containing protein n=1 Tax=Litoribacillus peritrichatus TaxID=718191 RepID=A0ABP7MPN7_9GAMM